MCLVHKKHKYGREVESMHVVTSRLHIYNSTSYQQAKKNFFPENAFCLLVRGLSFINDTVNSDHMKLIRYITNVRTGLFTPK